MLKDPIEDALRENIIENILAANSPSFKKSEANITLDNHGKVKAISAAAKDVLHKNFKNPLREGKYLWNLFSTSILKDFEKEFTSAFSGMSSFIKIPSEISENAVLFLFNPEPDQINDSQLINCTLQVEAFNILDQKRISEGELENREMFKSLFNNHPDAIFSFDLEGKFKSVNPAAILLSEGSLKDLIGKNFSSLIPKSDQARVAENFSNASKGVVQQYKTGFISLEKNHKTLSVSNFPLLKDDEIIGVFGIARDITDIEETKLRLKEKGERHKKILEQSLDVICTIDEEGKFIEVSAASLTNWGYYPKELIGRNYMDLVHPDDITATKIAAAEIVNGKDLTNFSNRYIKKDGTIIPNIWSVRWEKEEKIIYGIAKDASDLQEAQKQILRERNLLKSIIDNIPDYIFVIDKEHRTILSNKKFYSEYLGGIDENITLNLKPSDYFPKEEAVGIMRDNEQVMESGIPVINREDVVYNYNGVKHVILLSKVPFKTETGEVEGMIGIARNITSTYNLEQEQKLIFQLINSLSNSSNITSGLKKTIFQIAEYLNLEYAEAWQVGYDDSIIRKVTGIKIFNSEGVFENSALSSKKGEGLPGKTWQEKSVQIWNGIQENSKLKNQGTPEGNKISIGIGVPLIFKNEVIAVLSFYGVGEKIKENSVSDFLERISVQISTAMQRKITENQLNNMFAYTPNLIAVLGLDGYLKRVNSAFTNTFGYTEPELLNNPFRKFLHPDEHSTIEKRLNEVASGRKPQSFQNRCLAKDGSWKWISWTPSEFIEEDGIVHLFGIDITPIKTANLELLKYRNIIESTKDGVGLVSVETNEVFLNNSLKKALGFSESDLNGLGSIKELYADEQKADIIFKDLLEGKYWDGDVQLVNKKGELLDFLLSAGPIFNESGELIAVFGLHTDIRERKIHEESLQKYSNRISNILESITDGFFSVTKDWKVTYWNKEAENLTKVSRVKVINKHLWDYFPNAKKSFFYTNFKNILEKGNKISFEEYFKPLEKWLEVNAYPGKEGFSVYFKDITEKKKGNEQIRAAKERYELISMAILEAVYEWDIQNNVLEWSDVYYQIFGFTKKDADETFLDWEKNLHPDDREAVIKNLNEVLKNPDKSKWVFEYRLIKADQKVAFVIEKGFIIRNENGEAINMVGSLQDITELKQNERSLEDLNLKLENRARELSASNLELEQFAYIASHDLQEPLRMVTSFLTQLQKKYDKQLDEKAQQYIYFATDGAIRMRQIILDLLEYSRVGRMDYKIENVNLNELITDVISLNSTSIKESGAKVNFGNLPVIEAAKIPLQRLFSNLIGNSLKYKKEGEKPVIEISAKELDSFWEFQVKDNGIGINKNFRDRIFVIFQRLHAKDEYTGTGIGLAICKKIAENHGGNIWVESEPGKGSTFHLTIKKQF